MRIGTFQIAAICTATVWLSLGYIVSRVHRQQQLTRERETERIWRVLAEPAELQFHDVPLQQALSQLGERHNLRFRWSDPEARSLAERRVCCELSGVSLDAFLTWMLRPLHLNHAVRDAAVVIDTRQHPDAPMATLTRVYALPPPAASGTFLPVQQVADLITEMIAPYSWTATGGVGEIHGAPGALVIVHTPKVHEEIQTLLTNLSHGHGPAENGLEPVYLSPWDLAESRVLERLEQTASVQFDGTPLADVCQDWSKRFGVPMIIAEGTNVGGVPAGLIPITRDAEHATLKDALHLMLRTVGLDYRIRDEAVQISAGPGFFAWNTSIRLYPVRDLVHPNSPDAARRLVQLLRTVVAPYSWQTCRAEVLSNRSLLVDAQPPVHAEVAMFLARLRHATTGDESDAAELAVPDSDRLPDAFDVSSLLDPDFGLMQSSRQLAILVDLANGRAWPVSVYDCLTMTGDDGAFLLSRFDGEQTLTARLLDYLQQHLDNLPRCEPPPRDRLTPWQEELVAEILDDGVDPLRRTYLAYVLITTGPRPADRLVRDLQSLEASLQNETGLPLKRILAEANRRWMPIQNVVPQTGSGMGGMGLGGG